MNYIVLGGRLAQLPPNSTRLTISGESSYDETAANPEALPTASIVEGTQIVEDGPDVYQTIAKNDRDDHAADHQEECKKETSSKLNINNKYK